MRAITIRGILTLCLLGGFLTARGQDPRLTSPSHPLDANVSPGSAVTFRVFATTTNGPLTYQWHRNGNNLPNATNVNFVITNVTVADAGGYMVTVWNASSESTNSRTAILTVDPTFTKITQGSPATDLGGSTTATWIDYDQDGWLDLFVGNATGSFGVLNFLYHNNGDGSFTKITTNFVGAVTGSAWGVTWGDYDNDGRVDLYVANTENRFPSVFHNEGGGGFTRVTNGPLVDTALDGIMPLWGDYDNDGFIDLFLSTGYWSGPQKDRLYHNEGNGAFRIMTTAEVGAAVNDNAQDQAFGWNDYDNDGDLDLFVAYMAPPFDSPATNFVFRNSLNGPFEKVALTNFDIVRQCWGAAWGDYDNDGYPDVFLPSWFYTNALFKNLQGQGFTNVAASAGLALAMGSEGSAWGDYDNDGWLDLFVGNYEGQPNYPGGQALFHNNQDGTFTRITSGSPAHEGGRVTAIAWGDYDNDGFLDVYVACGDGTSQRNLFYRNNGNSNHWLKVKLLGTASNRLGVGAKVRVLANIGTQSVWQMRTITGQHSWVADNGLLAHFGLGDATNITTLRIEWPSGNVQELTNVGVDQTLPLTVTESVGITPVRPSASLNGSATLTRSALAGAAYQWRFDGVDLIGQTNRILNLTNILASQEGRYSVVVSNATTFTTNFVYLAVDTQFTKITAEPWSNDLGNSYSGVIGDYDADGYLDIFNSRYRTGRSTLYHNNTNGTFSSITNSTFPLPVGDYYFQPCSDFDNDGRVDFFAWAGASAPSLFFYGNGDGTFAQVPLTTLIPWSMSAVDYDHDGLLDLYCTDGGGSVNRLFRNLGGRTFQSKTSAQVGAILGISTFGGAAWADYDDDGWEDVVTPSKNSNRCLLYRNLGGRFVGVTNLVTQTGIAALVAGWGDYDNDGLVDLCVGAFGGQSAVFRNLGGGNFERASIGLTIQGQYNGVAWGDYDNDGFLDLFMTYGNNTGNSLFRNNGNGTFTAITTGSLVADRVTPNASYAGIWFDYDNDGFLDLFVPNGNDNGMALVPNYLYHNNGNSNAWLKVKLVGTTSNREGAGAKVRVRANYAGASRWQRRDITSGGDGYNGAGPIAHFGLGNATSVTTLRIEWPSGTVQELSNVTTNQLTIVEPRRPLLSLEATTAGFTGTLKADTNQTYQVHASDDLAVGWTVLTNITTDATGTAYWSDPGPAPQGYRFYKAVK